MICYEEIYKKARQTVKRCGSRNPSDVADMLGIHLYYEDFSSLLGMYTCKWRRRMIFINSNINGPVFNMVLAHEIGHDLFHRSMAGQGLREYNLFGIKDETEQTANAFAAHLLLDERELSEQLLDGRSISEISASMLVDENLTLIKLAQMNALGWDLRLPCPPRSDFIKYLK